MKQQTCDEDNSSYHAWPALPHIEQYRRGDPDDDEESPSAENPMEDNDELQEDKFFYSKMSWLTTNTTAVHLVGWNCLHSGKQLNEQKKKKDTEKKVRGKELKMVLIHM